MLHKLQYISQGLNVQEHLTNIRTVLDAGVLLVQLRLKHVSDEVYLHAAYEVKEMCASYAAQLIINDNGMVAQKIQADALHLGLTDMKVEEARNAGISCQIGGTANTFEQIQQRVLEGVDYIGLGPHRFTVTKQQLSPVIGLEGYRVMMNRMKKEKFSTPVYAIGGIEIDDIPPLLQTGVYGIAVSGLLTAFPDKEKIVKEINTMFDHA